MTPSSVEVATSLISGASVKLIRLRPERLSAGTPHVAVRRCSLPFSKTYAANHQSEMISSPSARAFGVVSASADISNNQRNYPPPPPRSRKAGIYNTIAIADSDSITCASSSTPISASSQPPKRQSPICTTQVPNLRKTASSSPSYAKPIAGKPKLPPPPRQSPNPAKFYTPPPRSKSYESHQLAMSLVNSKIKLPLTAPAGSSSKSHKIPGPPPPKFSKRSQFFPPPPRPRPPIASGTSETDVYKNNTFSRRRKQEEDSDLAVGATSNVSDQKAPCLSRMREQLSHAKGVIAQANTSSNSQPSTSMEQTQQQMDYVRMRQDYKVGDTARTTSHMVTFLSPDKATEALQSLCIQDFAFVKRADGRFTYAKVAFRTDKNANFNQSPLDESITFLLTPTGSTKTIKKSYWSEFVRLLSPTSDFRKDQAFPFDDDKARLVQEFGDGINEQDAKLSHQKGQQSKLVQQNQREAKAGFRIDYKLGEAARSASHMIIETDPQKAIDAVSSLSVHDFAFVENSDGLLSYAILALRSYEEPEDSNGAPEECMTFVLSESGCTATVKKSHWSECIRLASPEYGCKYDQNLQLMQQDMPQKNVYENERYNHGVEDFVNKLRSVPWLSPPETISFDGMEDDGVSCISTPFEIRNEYSETKFTPSQAVILE